MAVALAVTLGSPLSGYRTAVAKDSAVVKTVTVTGTVEPVDRVTLSFGVGGTVATVAVHVGERVAAGQTLATLATTALNLQVRQDKAALLAAQAIVAADEKGQAAGTPAGGGGSGGGTSTAADTSGGASTAGTPTSGGSGSSLQEAQQAVVAAQKTADAAEQAAASALSLADTACGTAPGTGTGPTSIADTPTASGTGGSPGGAAGSGGAACATALHQALGAQQTLATDQQAVTQAETALATLLATGGGTGTGTGTGTSGTGTGRSGSTGAAGGTHPGAGTTTGGTSPGASTSATTAKAEASQLAGDQASVDTADATLLGAQQSLAEADLTSPIAGTVGAVDLTSGQTASTGTGTPEITILTRHTFEAEGLVNPSQVPALGVGDAVHVTVDGRTSPITGHVTRIGPVDTDLGDQYPVIVALPAGIPRLFTGSLCQMTVVLRVASRALAVPTSAVHTAHGHSYVNLLDNGTLHRADVAVGIVGTGDTQILSGLRTGEHVVLATLTRPLPKPSNGSSGHANRGFPIFRGGPPGGSFFVTPTGRGSVTIYSGA